MSTEVILSDQQTEKLREVSVHYYPDSDPDLAEVVETLCRQQLEPGYEIEDRE